MTDPYASPKTAQPPATRKQPRWLRRAIILNGALLAILLVSLAAAYVFVRLSIAWDSETRAGGPVVYQHFFWISVDPWFATAYFTVPNGILAGLFARWKFCSMKARSKEAAVG